MRRDKMRNDLLQYFSSHSIMLGIIKRVHRLMQMPPAKEMTRAYCTYCIAPSYLSKDIKKLYNTDQLKASLDHKILHKKSSLLNSHSKCYITSSSFRSSKNLDNLASMK